MRNLHFNRAFAGLAILLLGCGGKGGQTGDAGSGVGGQTGGDGSASCVTASPCGGNIVGTWRVSRSCITATKDLTSVCAGASAVLAYMFSGTVTYNSDGTTSQSLTATIGAHEQFPNGCTPFGLTCGQLDQTNQDAGTGNCTSDATGTCTCDSVTPATTSDAPITYSTSGGTLTTTNSTGTTSVSSYCVQGSTLYEFAAPGDAGLTTMGGIVLTKQ